MKKLSEILVVKKKVSSEIVDPNIKLTPPHGKNEKKIVLKHKIEKHDDPYGNDDKYYKGKSVKPFDREANHMGNNPDGNYGNGDRMNVDPMVVPVVIVPKKEETELDELSTDTLKSYMGKAKATHPPGYGGNTHPKAWKHTQNILRASDIVHDREHPVKPKVHNLSHMSHGDAYDYTQVHDHIKDGDVLKVKGGAAVMMKAWPTMVHGHSDAMHHLKDGASWDTSFRGRYKKSADLAHSLKEETEPLDERLTVYTDMQHSGKYKLYHNDLHIGDIHHEGENYHAVPTHRQWAHGNYNSLNHAITHLAAHHSISEGDEGLRLEKIYDNKPLRTITEKLSPSMGASKYIDDFVHSDNERFAGKSKKERIRMALGAFYGAKKEETDLDERYYVRSPERHQYRVRVHFRHGQTGQEQVQMVNSNAQNTAEAIQAAHQQIIKQGHSVIGATTV